MFSDLRVWQQAMTLTLEVYRATSKFPRSEVYGISQQMRRAAVSVPSNIAEGKGYRSDRQLAHFLCQARGSLQELQTQVMIAEGLEYLTGAEGKRLLAAMSEIGRNLNALLKSVSEKAA